MRRQSGRNLSISNSDASDGREVGIARCTQLWPDSPIQVSRVRSRRQIYCDLWYNPIPPFPPRTAFRALLPSEILSSFTHLARNVLAITASRLMGEGHNHVVATSVPPNASQLYWSDKLAGSHFRKVHLNVRLRVLSALALGSSLDSFPDLTGNRPGAKSAQHEREIASSQISLNDLEKAVALIGTTPLAVAQTAWSLLLVSSMINKPESNLRSSAQYTYSESETPCVVFGTASKPTEGGAAALIPTILDISPSVQDPSAELTIADILERFARDNVIAQYHTFSRGSQEELRSDTALGVRCHDNEGLEEIEKVSDTSLIERASKCQFSPFAGPRRNRDCDQFIGRSHHPRGDLLDHRVIVSCCNMHARAARRRPRAHPRTSRSAIPLLLHSYPPLPSKLAEPQPAKAVDARWGAPALLVRAPCAHVARRARSLVQILS